MRIGLSIDSVAARAQLKRYGGKLRPGAIKAAARGLDDERKPLQSAVQNHVSSKLGGKGKLAKSYRVKVYDKKEDRLPQIRVYSKVPWAGAHEHGAIINGKMLIPVDQKLGTWGARGKSFKKNIETLRRGGNTIFVRNRKGQVILMAENQAEHDKPLSGFKRRYRKKHGVKKLKRGVMIPIAILVNKVVIKKRTDVIKLVESHVPMIAARVSHRLKEELFS